MTTSRGWGGPASSTTLVLVRHGVTDHTVAKRFSGGLASANPPLNDAGREQAAATGAWLAPLAEAVDVVVTSPVRRTRETAAILVERLGGDRTHDPVVEDAFAEMEFGTWDGLTYAEVHEQHADDLSAWLGDPGSAPHGGESLTGVRDRVLLGRDRLLAEHAGRTVVVVSHVTPIKVLVADAVGASLEAAYRMELGPASVTVLTYFSGDDGVVHPQLRLFNGRPTGVAL